jgi:hypothetical protein
LFYYESRKPPHEIPGISAMRARVVLGIEAGVILSVALALWVPLILSLLYRDGSWKSFLSQLPQ